MYQEGDSMQARGIIRKCFPLIQLVPFTNVLRTFFLGFSVTYLFIFAHIYGTENFFLKIWYKTKIVIFLFRCSFFSLYTCVLHLWNDHVFLKCLISMSPEICLKCYNYDLNTQVPSGKNLSTCIRHQNDDPWKSYVDWNYTNLQLMSTQYASKWPWNTNITLNHRKFWNFLNFPEINTYRLKSQESEISQTSAYKVSKYWPFLKAVVSFSFYT